MLLKEKKRFDYYAFGSPMPGRQFNNGSYRYSFGGKEQDNEIKGTGNSLDFGARIYDSRLGKFLSPDPLLMYYPDLSPYNYAGNSPIFLKDNDGRKITIYYEDENGNLQTVVLEKVSDLETYKNHENNFVRATVNNIIEINNNGIKTFIEFINYKNDNTNIIYNENGNVFISTTLIKDYGSKLLEGVVLVDATILYNPQLLSRELTKEAFDILDPLRKEIRKYDEFRNPEQLVKAKKDYEDAKSKLTNIVGEEGTAAEALAHEGDHKKHSKKDPSGYAYRVNKTDTYFDDKEEKKSMSKKVPRVK